MNLTIEQMREIVDGAPEGATEYRKLSCTTRYVRVGEKFAEWWDGEKWCRFTAPFTDENNLLRCKPLKDLIATIADHDRTGHCSDIKNHISPNTKVIEMSDLREQFERHQAGLLNIDYEELRDQFDRHEEIFGKRYVTFSDFEKEFELWQACWSHQQAIIDDLKAQLSNMEACYIEKKKQVGELQARANKALSVTGNYCDEDDAALLVFVLEKALRGERD